MSKVRRPTIFVSIASYRDPDCQNTVRDLFAKALHPERVFIGICWQFVPVEDDDCFVVKSRPEQVRAIEIHASKSQGVCWARHRVQDLYRNEDFYFQIDSHMRFVSGWDERLIDMLATCAALKPVLSTYPLAFTPPEDFAPDKLVTITPRGFDNNGILLQGSSLSSMDQAPPSPAPTAFLGAGMVFAQGRIVAEVPYDPHLYFEGEEITLAARLWTKGWDIFSPNRIVAYHDYGKRPDRPRHWKDQQAWKVLNERSRRRIKHLLAIESSNSGEDLVDIEKLGLGTARSLAAYEAFSGLDFKARLYRGRPLPIPELAADQPQPSKQRREAFEAIWRNNFWNCAETRSGSGSSMAATKDLRPWLDRTLKSLGARIVADAGCGDVNWMADIANELRFYFGYDIVPDLIDDLRARYQGRNHFNFSVVDIVTATLPECDAIICRDCLTHLPLDAGVMALKRFRDSGARFLVATSHFGGPNRWIKSGGWYDCDLSAQPFMLPAPVYQFSEGGKKTLGVWDLADILQY